jgi:hypothetical protein
MRRPAVRPVVAVVLSIALVLASCSAASDENTVTSAVPTSGVTEDSALPATGEGVWSGPNSLTALAVGYDGTIWAVGMGGVTSWDPSTGDYRVQTIADGLGSNALRDVATDEAGRVAVAHGYPHNETLWPSDVSVLDDGVWTSFDLSGDYPYIELWSVDLDSTGALQASSGAGVFRYVDGNWERTEDGPEVVLVAPVTDDDGMAWLPFWGVGLVRLPPDALTSDGAIDDAAHPEMHVVQAYLEEYESAAEAGAIASAHLIPGLDVVMGVVITDSGVWALGSPGIARWDGQEWAAVDDPEFSGVAILDAVSVGDATWFATSDGLVRLTDEGAERWAVPDAVRSITAHLVPYGDGVAAVSIETGLSSNTPRSVTALARDEARILLDAPYEQSSFADQGGSIVVPNVVVDGDGRLLGVDAYDGVFDVVAGDSVDATEPYARSIVELLVDGDGGIWADVGDGLWYLADDAWVEVVSYVDMEWWIREVEADATGAGAWLGGWDPNASTTALLFVTPDGTLTQTDPPPLGSIGAMTVDEQGVLMASFNAFHDGGVIVAAYDGSSWEAWDLVGAPDSITVLHRTPDGTIWAGNGHPDPGISSGRGLVAVRGGEWGLVTTGIPSADILAITSTGANQLWVGGTGGVAILDPETVPFTETGNVTLRTSTATTTTIAPTTTTTRVTTTTSGPESPPSGRYEVDIPQYQIPSQPRSNGYYGSGCSPGSGPLPDGIWFGHIEGASESAIDFDLICFAPPDATTEGSGRITNSSTVLRQVPVEPSAMVYGIDDDGHWRLVPYPAWYPNPGNEIFCPPSGCWDVWLYVNDGAVTEIVQLWFA